MTDVAYLNPRKPSDPSATDALPQSLLELPLGEARDCLLAVHYMLQRALPDGRLAVYEAGGGSTSFLPLNVLGRSHVTVVDIDETQVVNNTYAQTVILGDVQTHRFAANSFDLVICYNVLEHLPDVEAALLGFCHALRPGGLILIGGPDPASLSGVVTRYSPHWFHVWFYRHIRGVADAGQPGQPPFPTFFHPLVAPPRLEAFARARGFATIYKRNYESPRYQEMRACRPVFATFVDFVAKVVNLFLPGRSDVRRGDYHIILRKT